MWLGTVKIIDEKKKTARVHAEHSVDGEVDYAYNATAIIETSTQRTNIFKQIKRCFEAKMEKRVREEALEAGLGDTLTNALNNWENE
jgi:hypothetical protein